MRTVGFYNHANLGDLHISRELVKALMRRAKGVDRWIYAHRHSPRILQDIAGLEQVPLAQQEPYKAWHDDAGVMVWFNTWYAASPIWNSGSGMGCTLNTLHELFRDHARVLGCSLDDDVEHFIPTIDFSKYQIAGAQAFHDIVGAEYCKVVLVCNGETMSGQTRMPPGAFDALISDVVATHPDVAFLLSNKSAARVLPSNVFYTADVIGLYNECDLPENGYISTRCDVVIGRGSGAYSFAYLKDNFLDEKKKMVCFTDDERVARWVIPYSSVKANIAWSSNYEPAAMRALVEDALR